ncbi:MAG: cytochrome c biogenesis protein CcsA [Rikenellaceae bacterium]
MKRFLTSWPVALVLLLIYALALAVATFMESKYGTPVAKAFVYKSLWFIILQVIMVAVTVGVMIKTRLLKRKKFGVIILHISLIMILVGALVTYMFGFEGYMQLREGDKSNQMVLLEEDKDAPQVIQTLPFSLELKDFVLERYPGSHSPSSYESFVVLEQNGVKEDYHIYMNRVLDVKGYRIFQTSYHPDEKGSVLTINHDPYGSFISYLGYALMTLGFLMILFGKGSFFRIQLKELNALYKKSAVVLLFALLIPVGLSAKPVARSVNKDFASEFSRLQIQSPTGRMEPVNTHTEQLLRKLTRASSYRGLTSDQAILSIIAFPYHWSSEPLFETSNPDMQKKIGISGKSFSYEQLFNAQGQYRFDNDVQVAYQKPANERTRFDKELLKVDERANIFYALQQGQLLSLFPNDKSDNNKWVATGDDLSELAEADRDFVSKIMPWLMEEINIAFLNNNWEPAYKVLDMIKIYQDRKSGEGILQSPMEVRAELWYNKANVFSRATFIYMTLGLLMLLFALIHLNKKRRWTLAVIRVLIGCIVFVFLAHSLALATRAYISGRAPWANGYESMIYVAWSAMLAGVFFVRKSYLTLALSTFLSGVILLVAHLNFMDPEITPLVPVLKSYWLMLHVAIITSSYSFFGINFMLSALNLSFVAFKKKNEQTLRTVKELRLISELSLTIGLALMSVGTFLGAIWANESWGRYWGWDPKETWALITMVVYALVLHARYIPRFNNNFSYNVLSVYALASVLMTYFGVNYYLNGLHSYAGGTTPPALWGVFVIYGLVTAIVFLAWRKRREFN